MTLDLSFTKDPQWISQREQQWELIKQNYSSELTRKQRDVYRQYYLTGIPPKNYSDIYLENYILLFPLQTKEGLTYCFKHNIKADHEQLDRVVSLLCMRYFDTSEELGYPASLQLFDLFWGDRFDPNGELPFLIADEQSYRRVRNNSASLLYMLVHRLNGWLKYPSEDIDEPIEVVKINYFFSLLPHIPKEILSLNPIVERDSMTSDERDGISVRNVLVSLLKSTSTKFIRDQESEDGPKKIAFLKNLAARFDDLIFPEYPQELIDHWQWIKRRRYVLKIDFDTSPEEYESFGNIFSELDDAVGIYSDLERLKKEVKAKGLDAYEALSHILKIWVKTEKFRVEHFNYTEECNFYLVFSCTETECGEDFRKMFALCNARNIHLTDITSQEGVCLN